MSERPYGNVGVERLSAIWEGVKRSELQARLRVGDYSLGCATCGREVETEGRDGSYPELFDRFLPRRPAKIDRMVWPKRIEFNLSNSCNLQCVQCDGDLSSSIRIHRERRPALVSPYGDEFFEDIAAFLPHLETAGFAGGEPFLGAENFRLWDLIHELAPELPCNVVTNATQWNDRVERVLSMLRFNLVFSVDGITKETYESIRIGSDFDAVLANIERFRDYTASRGTTCEINHCLMVQNFHEFDQLLVWAEGRDIRVNVSVVRTPTQCSLAALPREELQEVSRYFEQRSDEVLSQLSLNADVWRQEVARIAVWAESGGHRSGADVWRPRSYILWFPRDGDGPSDERDARASLEAEASGPVHQIDVQPGDLVTSVSPSLVARLGSGIERLVGLPFEELQAMAEPTLGEVRAVDELHQTDDEVEVLVHYERTRMRVVATAIRDDTGWCTSARVLMAEV